MYLGVDDAGSPKPIWEDAKAQQAVKEMGFDFFSYHWKKATTLEHVEKLDAWAKDSSCKYVLNLEGAPREPGDETAYQKPGTFFQPGKSLVSFCVSSPEFLGFCYDEAAHWALDGGWDTIHTGEHAPFFYDAKGSSLAEAYAGNVSNLEKLMASRYPGFAKRARLMAPPVVSAEFVFPVMQHVFARAGIAITPKYLKETITPVHAAMCLGAARQYGVPYWACIDLWHSSKYPGHTPKDLDSALRFAYWTGAQYTYIENLAYNNSLYVETPDGVTLSMFGRAVKAFQEQYMPENPRTVRPQDFAPEIIIVRFPDTDWGQVNKPNWISGKLYGALNLNPDEQTKYWFNIWHVISHGTIPDRALNYNGPDLGIPFRFFFPANNVAVYDHLASDPSLYASAKLVFLTGKAIDPSTMALVMRLVRESGVTVVTPSHLSTVQCQEKAGASFAEQAMGDGRWIVCDDVTQEDAVELLKPYLGQPDEMRYVFGGTEVVFKEPEPGTALRVDVRPLQAEG